MTAAATHQPTDRPLRSAAELLSALGIELDPANDPQQSPAGAAFDGSGTISEGGRNAALMSFAGTLRRLGGTYDTIKPSLHASNQAMCDPPLSDAEVEAIAHSVCRYLAGTPSAEDLRRRRECPHTIRDYRQSLDRLQEVARERGYPDSVEGYAVTDVYAYLAVLRDRVHSRAYHNW